MSSDKPEKKQELKPSEEEDKAVSSTPSQVGPSGDANDALSDDGSCSCCDSSAEGSGDEAADGCEAADGHGAHCHHHHDHDEEMHIHESDPNDPVTAMCAKINKDLEGWEASGTLTKEKLNDALQRFDEALKLTSLHMEALLGKAYVQGELGQSEEAAETLFKAMAIDDKDIRVQTMLSQLGEFDDQLSGLDLPDIDLDVVEKYMNQKGDPTPKFKTALTEIFQRYAEPNLPKSTSPSTSSDQIAITKKGMDKFHHFVNGGPLSQSAMDYLFSGEWELNAQGNITLDGFISFYLNQTIADAQETVNDLRKLGYDEDLNPIASSTPTMPSQQSAAPPA